MRAPDAATEDQHEPGRYEIRLKGHLRRRPEPHLRKQRNNYPLRPSRRSAALYGVLRNVRDLGLPLVSVMEVEPRQVNGPDGNTDTDHTNKETHT